MLNIMIFDETVIEHGSLGAELMSINRIAETITRMDLKRMCKSMQAHSGRAPLTHYLDRPLRTAAN